jgi:hypothetical protein
MLRKRREEGRTVKRLAYLAIISLFGVKISCSAQGVKRSARGKREDFPHLVLY